MNGKDKISVIIPCYNVQKYIMRCFDSIYSQTYGFENLEVILIDDLSTDNTWSILESLQRQYPENVISLKIQKKGKCGGARNLGMDICTGKYITFVDADDYVHPDMLRVLYDRMTEDDYDVAQCGVSCFKADKPNVLEVNDFEIQRLDLDNVDNRKNLIIGLTGFTNVTAWAKLYSTKFIIEHNLRFIEDVYYEDTHFSMLCVLLAKKYCKVQSTLYYYFENTEGIIRSEISNAKIRDAKIIMDHIRQAIQSRKAELGNVIEQCYCEIQTFLLWHQYIEPYSRIETFMNRELDICKEEFLKSEPDIFNNPYVKFFSDDVVLKRMSKLRVTAKKIYHYAATLLMLHTNNEIDRAYYFTILRTPWGEQMEDGLLCNSMGRIVDRTGMLEKLLKKVTQNNIRLVFYGGENSSIRNAMRLLNRNFDSCEWHEHLKENEIICDDNTVYIVSAEADDGNGLEILANAGLENGENYFITQRFLHYTEGGFAL